MLLQPSGDIAWIGAIVWLLVYSNFERSYLSRLNSDLHVLGLYGKLFEYRIYPYGSDRNLVLTSLPKF